MPAHPKPDKPLTPHQERAITAIMAAPSILAAASMVGVHEATIHRWMRDVPAFGAELRKARRACFESAVGKLQQVATEAAETLAKHLSNPDAALAIRAAQTILQQCLRGTEAIDMAERLEELEGVLAKVRERESTGPGE